ncbi:MAG: cytochrome c, partial [Chthoniobacteraceae bacterium]
PKLRKSIPRIAGKICAVFTALHLVSAHMPLRAGDAKPQPVELPGIENAFRVTDRILSGSQPKLDIAFESLAKAGVKTIISVDGARPDVEAAKKHGLRYVHLPFGYDGIPANRIAELAKAAGPDAGTVFIHCHHGLHRGPAATAVICEAVAGWSPAQAETWLKQAGTSADYPGLYRAVREFRAPTPEDIARTGALPEVAKTPVLVDTMVAIDEHLDLLKTQQRVGWRMLPEDPETRPAHQATLLWEQLRELARTDDTARRPEDFRKLLTDCERSAATLRETLRASLHDKAGLDRALKQTTQSCAACHKAYRNEKK